MRLAGVAVNLAKDGRFRTNAEPDTKRVGRFFGGGLKPMAIRRKLIKIQLGSVDELIAVRKLLHGGGRGAPPIIRSGQRQGEAINKSCIVMLGAVLQAYVERVFRRLALRVFPHLNNPGSMDIFQKTYRRWGNPSAPNIVALFNKLAIDDVLENLSWRNCKNDTVRKRLIELTR